MLLSVSYHLSHACDGSKLASVDTPWPVFTIKSFGGHVFAVALAAGVTKQPTFIMLLFIEKGEENVSMADVAANGRDGWQTFLPSTSLRLALASTSHAYLHTHIVA